MWRTQIVNKSVTELCKKLASDMGNIYELKDAKPVPDIVQVYSHKVKDHHIPLIVDNGSYSCRVGWACTDEPQLIFRNLIAKPRKDRNKKDKDELPIIQIGNDIANIEQLRFQLKSQFDRNVVTHFYNQEQIFDYIFQHLGIDAEGKVPHPIILTECFSNPNYCRQLMSELLFECYDVPSVCYGIDSLFAFNQNQIGSNGLIISCGYHTTHIIPVLNNKIISQKVRRINLGGYHIITFMHRLLQLKYPVHINAISLSRIEWLLHNHCSIALDYIYELKKWASIDFYEEHVKKIQLPYNTPVAVTTLTAEQKFEKKRELAKRLADINARKREEKLAEDEDQLQKLLVTKDLFDDGDYDEFKEAIDEQSIPNYDELQKLIQATTVKIDKTRQKIAQAESTAQVFAFEEKPLTNIPQPPGDIPIDEWVAQTKQKRLSILERKQSRRQRKQDLAKRRTAAAQERMRIISQLARKEKGNDDFGMRDEDWDVYKTISKETGDSDSDAENEKMLECEEILRNHDPEFEDPQIAQGGAAEFHQLHIGVESIRASELLFQPSMIGSSEAGLAETVDYVLKMFDENEQLILANSVFLTGGCSNFSGLKERLSRELMEMRPFQTKHKIFTSSNATLDAWYGAKDVANAENLEEYLTTKSDYIEKGGEYFRENHCSNRYYSTPAPIIVETNE